MKRLAIHFAAYENIHYFYLLIPVFIFLLIRIIRNKKQLQKIVAARYTQLMLHNYSFLKKIVKSALIFLGKALMQLDPCLPR